MEFISLFIMAAFIYGIVGILTARNGPVRPPQRRTAPVPRPKPDVTRTEQRPWIKEELPHRTKPNEVSEGRRSIDHSKQEELKRSQGIEGAWGDEGRATKEQWSPEGISDYITTNSLGNTLETINDKEKKELVVNERNLVQGIIWAEVLGKPRSLRPFRSRF